MLKKIFSSAIANSGSWTTPRNFISVLSDMEEFNFIKEFSEWDDEINDIGQLMKFGRELYNRYQIRQFLLLSTKEYLNKLEKYNNL